MLSILIKRNKQTNDAYFGDLYIDNAWECYTMERISATIPPGQYNATMVLSPHFGFDTPHLAVPGRTYIEIHPANWPSQLEGCIAVGQSIDVSSDTLETSRAAFDALIAKLPPHDSFYVCIS